MAFQRYIGIAVFCWIFCWSVGFAEDLETGKDRRTDGVSVSYETASQFANLFTGSSSYNIPIDLPTGPGGFGPSLSIQYNSDKGNGWLGLGWEVSGLHCIQRSTRYGIPKYADPPTSGGEYFSPQNYDRFDLNLNGAHYELLFDYKKEAFVTHPEAYFKITYNRDSNGISQWQIINKNGVRYIFKGIPAVGRKGYRYYPVSKAVDPHANTINYSYDIDSKDGDYYPKKISYGHHAKEPANRIHLEVLFETEKRTMSGSIKGYLPGIQKDEVVSDFKGGSRMMMDKRIHRIVLLRKQSTTSTSSAPPWKSYPTIPKDLVQTYDLKYISSLRGHQSLLSEFRILGYDGDFLAYKFSYRAQNASKEGFQKKVDITTGKPPVSSVPNLWPLKAARGTKSERGELYPGVRWVDVNGDVLPDMVWGLKNFGYQWSGDRVGGKAIATKMLEWKPLEQSIKSYSGAMDKVISDYVGFPAPLSRWPNKDWGSTAYNGAFAGTEIIDVNGDGFVDVIHSFRDGSDSKLTWINNEGKGWKLDKAWNLPEIFAEYGWKYSGKSGSSIRSEIKNMKIVDVNGDGYPDMVIAGKGTYLNRGPSGQKGWETNPDPLYNPPVKEFGGYGFLTGDQACHFVDLGVRYVDLNGDGLVDVLVNRTPYGKYYGKYASTVVNEAWINTGHKQSNGSVYKKASQWKVPYNKYSIGIFALGENLWNSHLGTQLLDINGDGLPDLVYSVKSSEGKAVKAVVFNTGNGWGTPLTQTYGGKHWVDLLPEFAVGISGVSERTFEDNGVSFADFNGDGLPDIGQSRYYYHSQSSYNQFSFDKRRIGVWYNRFEEPLLSKVEIPSGGSITFQYRTSHGSDGFENHQDTNGVHSMPNPKQVVWSIQSDDGIRNKIETTMAYYGGCFDFKGKEFRGFRCVKVLPGGSIGKDVKKREIVYHFFQDDARKGKVASIRNGSSEVFDETLYVYQSKSVGQDARGKSYETLLKRSTHLNYDSIKPASSLFCDLNFNIPSDGPSSFLYTTGKKLTDYPWTGHSVKTYDWQILGGTTDIDLVPIAGNKFQSKPFVYHPFGGYAFNGLIKEYLSTSTPFPALSIQTWVSLDYNANMDQNIVTLYGSFKFYTDKYRYLVGEIYDGRKWITIKSTESLPSDILTHAAFTWDGTSTGRLYVNGVKMKEQTNLYGPMAKGTQLVIGGSLTATLDELKIFKTAAKVPKITQMDYQYDGYGNIKEILSYGDLGDNKDDFVQHTDYEYLNTPHIMNRPKMISLNHGTKYDFKNAETVAWLEYDSKGGLTKETYWGGVKNWQGYPAEDNQKNPVTRYQYDLYGNVLSEVDPLKNKTRFTYDSTFPVFPKKIYNALGDPIQIDYYGITANELDYDRYLGLFGQVKKVIGLNADTTRYVYDRYGRIRAVYGPEDEDVEKGRLIPSTLYSYQKYRLPSAPDKPSEYRFWEVYVSTRNKETTDFVTTYSAYSGFKDELKKCGKTSINTAMHFDENYLWAGLFPLKEQNTLSNSIYYLDGFGRSMQSVYEWDVDKNIAAYDALADYDGLGRVRTVYKPYLAVNKSLFKYHSTGTQNRHFDLSAPYFSPNYSQPKTHVAYDALGRVVKITGPDGSMTTFEYDQWQTTLIDPNAHKKVFTYDAYGRLIQVDEYANTYGAQADQRPKVVEWAGKEDKSIWSKTARDNYHLSDWLKEIGKKDEKKKDPYGFVVEVVLALDFPLTTKHQYDMRGNLTDLIDPQGNKVQYTYDALGQRVAMKDPDMGAVNGESWKFKYDLCGNITEITDAKGQHIGFEYDALNRPIKKRFYEAFPASDIKLNFGDPNPEWIRISGPWKKLESPTQRAELCYACDIQTVNMHEENIPRDGDMLIGPLEMGEYQSASLTFSSFHKNVKSREDLGDVIGLWIGNAEKDQWELLVDQKEIEEKNRPGEWGSMFEVPMDSKIDGPQWIRFHFHGSNLEKPFQYPNEGWFIKDVTVSGTLTKDVSTPVTWIYDKTKIGGPYAKGRLVQMNDGSGSLASVYDRLGQITELTRTLDGKDYTAKFDYDKAGRITSLTYPDNEKVLYHYGGDGFVNSVRIHKGSILVKDAMYDALGALRSCTFGNELETQYEYDTLSKSNQLLKRIATGFFADPPSKVPAVPFDPTKKTVGPDSAIPVMPEMLLQNLSYSYDLKGNIICRKDGMDDKHSEDYYYDAFDRLTQVKRNNLKYKYEYDGLGNLTKMGGDVHEYKKGGWAGPHAVTKVIPANAGSSSPGIRYTYDGNGNRIQMVDEKNKKTKYVYDYENHLVSVNQKQTFTYDGSGVRVKSKFGKQDSTLTPFPFYEIVKGKTMKYYYVNEMLIAKKDASLAPPNDLLFYHPEHLGSLHFMSNSKGEAVGELEYHPFGETRSVSGDTLLGKYRFTSQSLDSSGLYYYGARYYDPSIGKFVTPDPLDGLFREAGLGSSQRINLYSYVHNNPINYFDPSGLQEKNPYDDPNYIPKPGDPGWGTDKWGTVLYLSKSESGPSDSYDKDLRVPDPSTSHTWGLPWSMTISPQRIIDYYSSRPLRANLSSSTDWKSINRNWNRLRSAYDINQTKMKPWKGINVGLAATSYVGIGVSLWSYHRTENRIRKNLDAPISSPWAYLRYRDIVEEAIDLGCKNCQSSALAVVSRVTEFVLGLPLEDIVIKRRARKYVENWLRSLPPRKRGVGSEMKIYPARSR